MVFKLPRVWIITDPDRPDGPLPAVRRALLGSSPGRVGVQLRAKDTADRTLVEWGHELRALTSEAGSPLVVNQRADIAAVVAADGVHLPEAGLPIPDLRRRWPELGTVGVSRHDRAGLEDAQGASASYAFLSPVFSVPGKPPALGVEAFTRAIENLEIPVFALGGIDGDTVQRLRTVGAAGIAVRRAIYEASDPKEVIRQLVHELDNQPANVE